MLSKSKDAAIISRDDVLEFAAQATFPPNHVPVDVSFIQTSIIDFLKEILYKASVIAYHNFRITVSDEDIMDAVLIHSRNANATVDHFAFIDDFDDHSEGIISEWDPSVDGSLTSSCDWDEASMSHPRALDTIDSSSEISSIFDDESLLSEEEDDISCYDMFELTVEDIDFRDEKEEDDTDASFVLSKTKMFRLVETSRAMAEMSPEAFRACRVLIENAVVASFAGHSSCLGIDIRSVCMYNSMAERCLAAENELHTALAAIEVEAIARAKKQRDMRQCVRRLAEIVSAADDSCDSGAAARKKQRGTSGQSRGELLSPATPIM